MYLSTGYVTFIKGGMKKMTRLKKLSSWLVLVIILLAGFNVPSVSAQEDFTITVGEDKEVIITEFNYHNSWFEDDPNNPEPWPDQREAYSEGNIAYVSLSATPGHAGGARSRIGVDFEWDLGPYTWEKVKNWPVEVTINSSYHIEAYWAAGHGSANAFVQLPGFDPWYDGIGYEVSQSGSRGDTVSETYTTTVEELGGRISAEAYCQAHSAYMEDEEGNPIGTTHHSSAEVQISSIKIEILNPQITDFSVSLEYFVGPDEEEWYGQGVMATVYHPQGSGKIESFIAIDPTGEELPTNCPTDPECNITSDSWNFMWWEGYLPNPPTFGTYTITATDKDGRVATVTSWPTDHISDRVPTVTDPINHGYVTTDVPTFRWEPFSDRTTGYLIEVAGPLEETLPDDDVVWRIGLPSSQTEVQFNSDGAAAVPQLTPGNTYSLLVFAYEGVCSGIQCYRDTSIRSIEFTIGLKGDLLLGEGAKIVPGPWSHVGMYIGNGQVVESHPALGGVNVSSLKSGMNRYKTWAALRVVTADDEIRSGAVEFALDQVGKPYDKMWLLKQANGNRWYCSELVWAAYLNASNGQINIEHGPDKTGITPTEIYKDDDIEVIVEHYEEQAKGGFLIKTKCPVDLEVVDPENLPVNKQTIDIPGAIYGEDDIDGDGSIEDWIGIPEREIGNYLISVIPESDASPIDTYTLEVSAGDTTIILAEDVPVGDIPSQPYIIESTETGIIDKTPPKLPYVVSSDGSGTERNTFDLSENIYCYAGNLPTSTRVDSYVVNNKDDWEEGDELSDISGGYETETTGDDGIISTIQLWCSPLTQGSYDIVVDTNRDGEWNEGEPIDSWTTTGFEAIPEFTTIAIPVAIVLGLVFLISRRKRKE